MAARGFKEKASLTPEEELKAAYFHLVVGWEQHDIAAFYSVNGGRVAEAVSKAKAAFWPKSKPSSASEGEQAGASVKTIAE